MAKNAGTEIELPGAAGSVDQHADSTSLIDGVPAEWSKTYTSDGTLEEPKSDIPTPVGEFPAKGDFVGFGVEFLSRGSGEWKVNPETGLIIGPATGRKTSTDAISE